MIYRIFCCLYPFWGNNSCPSIPIERQFGSCVDDRLKIRPSYRDDKDILGDQLPSTRKGTRNYILERLMFQEACSETGWINEYLKRLCSVSARVNEHQSVLDSVSAISLGAGDRRWEHSSKLNFSAVQKWSLSRIFLSMLHHALAKWALILSLNIYIYILSTYNVSCFS
jgi:hypothetical protein